jgi:Flp pilus assembly pilin Flp
MPAKNKYPSRASNLARGKRLGQTATEYALLLAAVALVVFAKFGVVMATTASTTSTVSREVANSAGAKGSGQSATGGGVTIEWGAQQSESAARPSPTSP